MYELTTTGLTGDHHCPLGLLIKLPLEHNWPHNISGKLQDYMKGETWDDQNHQRSHLHQH